MFILLILTLNLSFGFGQDKPSIEVASVHSQLIFEEAPFDQCHASSIAELGDGQLMAVWFGGTREGAEDVSIWSSKYDGTRWGPVSMLVDGMQNPSLRHPCWNPVLYRGNDDRLHLFYKVGPTPRNWWGGHMMSDDYGSTWSPASLLPTGFLGPIRAKPIALSDGTLLCPSSTESESGDWKVHMEVYNPGENTWSRISIPQNGDFHVIQPTILQHSGNILQILCRSQENRVIESWSEDNGRSWSTMSVTYLPNPSAGIDGVSVHAKSHFLVYNPTVKEPQSRRKLHLAHSTNGIDWNDVLILENESSGEYSYPAIIQTSDGNLHITYTWKRKSIKHVVVRLAD